MLPGTYFIRFILSLTVVVLRNIRTIRFESLRFWDPILQFVSKVFVSLLCKPFIFHSTCVVSLEPSILFFPGTLTKNSVVIRDLSYLSV